MLLISYISCNFVLFLFKNVLFPNNWLLYFIMPVTLCFLLPGDVSPRCGQLFHFLCVLYCWEIVYNNSTCTNQLWQGDFWDSQLLSVNQDRRDSYVIGRLLFQTKAAANHITVSGLFVFTDRDKDFVMKSGIMKLNVEFKNLIGLFTIVCRIGGVAL